jgi:glycosyltransferase involved in cell wall biosynthesis
MKKNKPLISVIIPVFNQEKFIGRCLRSIIKQSIDRDLYEVIVINDCSEDLTKYALSQFHNEIKVLENKKNMGLPSSLNKGINESKGEYIIRLDSDDYVNVNYLLFLYEAIITNDYDAVSCDYYLVDDNESIIERKYFKKNPIGCAILFKKNIFNEIGYYNEEFLRNEEQEFMLRFNKNKKIMNLPIPLYRYRRHDSNITNNEVMMNYYNNKLKEK